MNTNIKFTNKEEYLAYRSNWKAQYKELSQQIRDAKFCHWFHSLKREDRIKSAQAHYDSISSVACDWYSIYKMKKQATAMLEELKEAKVEAQRQYLASKEKDVVMA